MRINSAGIIGMGVVGTALYQNSTRDMSIYDLKKGFTSFDNNVKLLEDVLFIAVGTPTDVNNKQDASQLQNVLDILVRKDYSGLVIINSTILFSNIESYLDKLKIVVSPEFLSARNAAEDFYNTEYMVIGGTYGRFAAATYNRFFEFNNEVKVEYCTIEEAIDFKYMRNIHQAYNVLFWEGIQDITGNANKFARMLDNIPVGENSNISQDGYRGFGQSLAPNESNFSACLDKDVCAKLTDCKPGKEHIMLQYINNYNQSLI